MAAPPAATLATPALLERVATFGAGVVVSAGALLAWQLLFSPPAPRAAVPVAPTPAAVIIHVAGEVRQPGVYELPASARIDDALRLAGGPTDDGEPGTLNLAARVADGQKIMVPRRADTSPTAVPARSGSSSPPGEETPVPLPAAGSKVNINVATASELDRLPGVGGITVQKIVEQRQKARFTSVEQLIELKIVNSATFARIRDLVTVE